MPRRRPKQVQSRGRVIDEADLWRAATTVDPYFGITAMEWFEQHIQPDWLFNCWVWTGWKSGAYGRLSVLGQSWNAHRFSYEIHRGSAFGLDVDHLCRNTMCVNPWHLEAVSMLVNVRRGRGFWSTAGWDRARQAHCGQLHAAKVARSA